MKKGLSFLLSLLIFVQALVVYIPVSAQDNNETYYDEYIVKYKDTETVNQDGEKTRFKARNNYTVKKELSSGLQVIHFENPEDAKGTLKSLESDNSVEYVVPNYKLELFAAPTAGAEARNILNGFDDKLSATQFSEVLVGIVDTGVALDHPAYKEKLFVNTKESPDNGIDDDGNGFVDDLYGWDFANNDNDVTPPNEDSHGTAIAGIIAGSYNDSSALAPNAKIVPLQIFQNGIARTSDAIEAIEYAKKIGIQIINCSWGTEEFNYPLKEAMMNSGILFICASSNENTDTKVYPAGYELPNIVSVGSVNANNQKTYPNQNCDVFTLGENIYSSAPNLGYGQYTGTSFSAAIATGIASLVYGGLENGDAYTVGKIIMESRTDNNILDPISAIGNAFAYDYSPNANTAIRTIFEHFGTKPDEDIALILESYDSVSSIPSDDLAVLTDYFSVSKEDLLLLDKKNIYLADSLALLLSLQKINVPAATLNSLITDDFDLTLCTQYIQDIENIKKLLDLNDDTSTYLLQAVLSGKSMTDLLGPAIVSGLTDTEISKLVKTGNRVVCDTSSLSYDGVDTEAFIQLCIDFYVSESGLQFALNSCGLYPSELRTKIQQWQAENNFYIHDSTLKAYEANVSTSSIYNKYQMPGAGDIMNNLTVSNMYGMITYNQDLLKLEGKNGLTLNLGMRYDQDDAFSSGNIGDIADMEEVYQAKYITELHMVSDGKDTIVNENLPHSGPVYKDPTLHNVYLNTTSFVEEIDESTYFVYIVKSVEEICAETLGDISESLVPTAGYNQTRYNLGNGWAFNFPSIEIHHQNSTDGRKNILHFRDGQKYSIQPGDNGYTLLGYQFKDITLQDADTNEFSSYGRSAKWVVSYKNGNCDYFDETGAYLGSTDRKGSAATASIHIQYDSNNLISNIYDSVGRRIEIVYRTVSVPPSEINPDPMDTKEIDIKLYDKGASTGKLLYRIEQFFDWTIGQYINVWLHAYDDNETSVKDIRFSYMQEVVDIWYNFRGGTVIENGTILGGKSEVYETTSIVLQSIEYYNDGNISEEVFIDYNLSTLIRRAISETSYREYARVSRIMNRKYTLSGDPNIPMATEDSSVREYDYSTVDSSGNEDSVVNTMGNWDDQDYCIYPKVENLSYKLTVKDSCEMAIPDIAYSFRKRTEYLYNTNRQIYEMNVYDEYTNSLYSKTRVDYDSITQLPIKETVLHGTGSTQLATISSSLYDDYGNVTESKIQYGYATNFGTPTVSGYASETYQTFGENKYIPIRIEEVTARNDNTVSKLVTVNELEPGYSLIKKSTISATQSEAIGSSTELKSTEYYYDSEKVNPVRVVEKDLTGYGWQSPEKETLYTYDSKYGIYTATVTKKSANQNADGTTSDVVYRYLYDMFGRVVEYQNNDDSHTYTYEYDALGTQSKIVGPDGLAITTQVDYTNLETTETLQDGTKIKYVYDTSGKLSAEYSYNSHTSQFELITEYMYDTAGNIIRKTSYQSADKTKAIMARYAYDFLDRPVNTMLFDQDGNMLSVQVYTYEYVTYEGIPCEKRTLTQYNGTEETAPQARTIEYTDAAGNLIAKETEYVAGQFYSDRYYYYDYQKLHYCEGDTIEKLTYAYDSAGRVESITDINGFASTNSYDGFGRTVAASSYQGDEQYLTYDALDRVVKVQSAFVYNENFPRTYYREEFSYYDVYGNLIQQSVKKKDYAYDQDNMAYEGPAYTDYETKTHTYYSYDENDRLIMVEEEQDEQNAQYTQYVYDEGGRLRKAFTGLTAPLTITDVNTYTPNGDVTYSVNEYQYDSRGNKIKFIDPLGQEETYVYDFANRMTSMTLRNGKTLEYTYDPFGRCLSVQAGGIAHTLEYDYLGRVLSSTDENGTTTYTYDLLDRVLTETRDDTDDTRDYQMNFAYDATGMTSQELKLRNTATNTYELKYSQSFGYDSRHRLSQTTLKTTAGGNDIVQVDYTYSDDDLLTDKIINVSGNTYKTYYTYNRGGFLTNSTQYRIVDGVQEDTFIYSNSLSYDIRGNIVTRRDNGIDENRVTTYTYDAYNRLIKEIVDDTDKTVTTTYAYDESNNRISAVESDSSKTGTVNKSYVYNAADQLTHETVVDSSETKVYTYTYDDGGNLLTKNQTVGDTTSTQQTHEYDAFNRLSLLTTEKGNTAYKYDATGYRITKTTGAEKTHHYWSGDSIIFDEQIDGSVVAEQGYVFGSGLEATTINGSAAYSYIQDVHGDVKYLQADDSVNSYTYDAYGNTLSGEQTISNPYRYNGQYYDEESGNYYLRARYYDTSIGRFTQEDTVHGDATMPGTLNRYNYAGGNPVMITDPSGHAWETFLDILSFGDSLYTFIKEPSWGNAGMLIWDTAALVTPAVPGSYVAKVVKTVDRADDFIDAVKTADRIDDTTDALRATDRVLDNADNAVDAGRAAKRAGDGADALIDTAKAVRKGKGLDIPNSSKIVGNSVENATEAAKKAEDAQNALELAKKQKAELAAKSKAAVAELQQNAAQKATKVSFNDALKILDKSGLRPGQTEISRKKVMQLIDIYDPLKAQSSVYSDATGRYLVEGHHTTIATTMLGRKPGINMNSHTNDLPSVKDVYWTKKWYEFGKKTIIIRD